MSAAKRPLFLFDLAGELTWLNEKAGAEVAEKWYPALVATIQSIEQHPFVGRERKDSRPSGIRSWRVRGFPRWLIFYEVTPSQEIVLYRIRSATMNLLVLNMKS